MVKAPKCWLSVKLMALKMDGAKPAADTLGHGVSRDPVGGRLGWAEAGP